MQLRVCLICPTYPPIRCGIGDVTHRLAIALVEHGLEVHVVTSEDSVSAVEERLEPGIFVHRVVKSWRWQGSPSLVDVLGKIRPEIVHLQFETAIYGYRNWSVFFMWWDLKRHGYRVVTTLHEIWGPKLLFIHRFRLTTDLVNSAMVNFIVRYSEATLLTNVAYEQETFSMLPSHLHKRIHLVGQGSPFPSSVSCGFSRCKQRESLGVPDDATVVAHFGFLRHDKGTDLVIRAFADVAKRDIPVRLLIIGDANGAEMASYKHDLESLIRSLRIGEVTIWLPYLAPQAVVDMLSCADMIVLPYLDGVSMRRTSFMTALELGLPIVTTLSQDVPLTNLDPCVYLTSPEVSSIAEGMLAFMSHDCRERREGGAATAMFTWETVARDTIDVYASLL